MHLHMFSYRGELRVNAPGGKKWNYSVFVNKAYNLCNVDGF
jgi:hypothetical protein